MKDAENFEFDRSKIYCVYTPHESYPGKFIKAVRMGENLFLCFRIADKGWGFQKNVYIQAQYVTEILEFDSVHEYEEHRQNWEEEEKEKKFKTDF